MQKLIISLICAILIAFLGIFGFSRLRNLGPRQRIETESGNGIIVEEMSYYVKDSKRFGKVFKPADENGNFPDSLGKFPTLIFFHEPLKTEFSESILKTFAPDGIIGYDSALHGKSKDVVSIVKRIRGERFTEEDLIFIIADSYSAETVMKAVSKLGRKVQGLVLIDPKLTGSAGEIYRRYQDEFLTISAEDKARSNALIRDYLESRGALK